MGRGRGSPTFGTRLKHFEAIYLTNCQAVPNPPISVVKLAINGAKALSKHCGAQHIQGVPRHVLGRGKSKSSNPKPYGIANESLKSSPVTRVTVHVLVTSHSKHKDCRVESCVLSELLLNPS